MPVASVDPPIVQACSLLRERLTGNYACDSDNKKNVVCDEEPFLLALDDECGRLMKLLEQTALYGESNSVLLCGPRGAGKTTLLRHVLHRIKKKKEIGDNLLEVYLHGLTLTDDRVTLKEIARQLKLENVMDDGKVRGSFAETLKFFLDSIKVGDSSTSKPILFVLEEFDEFTSHTGQALLYNLFDISQSRSAPVCVVGLTCRLDVVELLEKRVKSRFSHRQIHIFPKYTLAEYVSHAGTALSLPTSARLFSDTKFAKKWNAEVQTLLKDGDDVKELLIRLYSTQKEMGYLYRFLFLVISQLSSSSSSLSSSHFTTAGALFPLRDSKSSILRGVSVLELCLLISMQRLADLYGMDEPMNFAMIYQEYKKFNDNHSMLNQSVASRSIVIKAFERLLSLELIRWSDGAGGGGGRGGGGGGGLLKEFRPVQLLVGKQQLLETARNEKLPTAVEKWIETAAHA